MAATDKTRTLYPSLFNPDSEEGSDDSASDVEILERPHFVPLDEAIKEPPKTLATLLEILLPRLTLRADLKTISTDDQQSFINILIGELTSKFSLLQHQIDDPFLNGAQNLDLHRKVVIHVCVILEKLYAQYVSKAAAITKNNIFTLPANLSRLKAQLILQANKSLNISAIRRSIIAQLNGTLQPLPQQPLQIQMPPHNNTNATGKYDPGLRGPLPKKLLRLGVRSVPNDAHHSSATEKEPQVPSISSSQKPIIEYLGHFEGDRTKQPIQLPATEEIALMQLHKAKSMPNLEENFTAPMGTDNLLIRQGEGHAGSSHQTLRTRKALSIESIMDLKMDTSDNASQTQQWTYEHTLLGQFTNTEVNKDLKRLCNEWITSSNQEDLDPLLQAQVHALSKNQVCRLAKHQAQKKEESIRTVTCNGSENPTNGSGDHINTVQSFRATNIDPKMQDSSTFYNIRDEDGNEALVSKDRRIAQAQPSVIASVIDGMTLTRTSDIRVSERSPLTTLRLQPSCPIYNELTGELEQSMIRELDQNLNEGGDLIVLYEEVLRALPKNHLNFIREPQTEPSISHTVNLSKVLASETLHHRKSCRVVNNQLRQLFHPPWEASNTTKKVWEERPQDEKGDGKCSSQRKSRQSSHNLWSSHGQIVMDSQDYFKFVSRQATDYLGLVYHLYDSDGTDSETEEDEKLRRQQLAELHCRLKAREAKRKQLNKLKSNFQAGEWNVNTVMMGGLGKDPELSSDEEDLENLTHTLTKTEGTGSEKSMQERLCTIWSRLHFSPAHQMDMAIKYSSEDFSVHLNAALDAWEHACAAIEKREQALVDLQSFEKAASDPARFFAKGHLGSSVARLEEAKQRDQLHQILDQRDQEASQIVRKIFHEYGDRVSYNGRLYQEKMACDRTEMLYWLQQERRKEVLKPAIRTLHIEVPPL